MSPNQKPTLRKDGTPIIVLTGGGSGGHITPLLSLARELKKASPGCKTIYIGHKGDKFEKLKANYDYFDEVKLINAGKFRRYHGQGLISSIADVKTLFLNARDFFRVFTSISSAYRILQETKPDVVFSKGSFVALPVGIAARALHVPIITHDSDTTPGLANKFIGRWAAVHATGMPSELYTYPKDTIKYVGIPVGSKVGPVSQKAQKDYKHQIGVEKDNLVLLVAGSSLGARDINNLILPIAPRLLSSNPGLHIVHITGQQNESEVKSKYHAQLNSVQLDRVTILGFSNEFYKYSGAADLIITRAGATSLAEFSMQGKPCIIIPSPFLTGGHQLKNAEQLKKLGAAEVVNNDSTPENLLNVASRLLQNKQMRDKLADNFSATARPNAAKQLAEIILSIASRNS